MSTASPSVPTASPSQYGASSVQHAQTQCNHGGGQTLHGHANAGMGAGSETHVNHASSAGLYQDNVAQGPHHLGASSFPGAQVSPMSPYAAYGAAQHPMYGGSYASHAYPSYPNYMGHIPHYTHPPHYPAASSTAAYHSQMMNSMIPHSGYSPHTASHMSSHHTQAGIPISMGASPSGGGLPTGPGGAMANSPMMQASSYGAAPQYGAQLPLAGRHRVTTTLWEDEGTLCFQVDVKGVCVARRNDNNMVNGTKLLNVCGMSRGKRDGILKNEKERIVVKVGAMHLKGVWIAFNRAKQLAEQHGIADALYPLFEPNIQSFLYHPDNYPRTAAVMAAAQERHVQRHYASPAVGQAMKDVGGGDIAAGVPLHTGLDSNHWGSASQSHESSGAADSALHYQYQHHPHYQHHASMVPPPTNAGPGMFSASAPHYASQAMTQPVRAARSGSMAMERRAEHAGDQSGASGTPSTLSSSQGGVHRRISGMKRSNEDYMSSPNDSGHLESEPSSQPSNSAPASTAASVPGNADTFSSNNFTQNFSLDDNMKMTKRPKVTESASQPSLPLQTESAPPMQSVYNGEHAVKPNTRTQPQTD